MQNLQIRYDVVWSGVRLWGKINVPAVGRNIYFIYEGKRISHNLIKR